MDSIANLITYLRNAELARHSQVEVPTTKVGTAILGILKQSGFITSFEDGESGHTSVSLSQPITVHHYKRVSKPGRRVYTKVGHIPTVLRGLGIVILSTPTGIISGKEAKKRGVGGEILCEVF
ncbi:30S ribosomal protein S8 [Patescibacteria group bacterium]|nr:30S ribosomal protein S8 [Patescibacteria group bacterium]